MTPTAPGEVAALVALVALPAVVCAAEPETLDEDFLEYLAELDQVEDDWSWFADEDKASETKSSADQKTDKSNAAATQKVER
ncbi:MAG: hypothetical protein ACJ8OJ_12105 [Povalibacter sp.]